MKALENLGKPPLAILEEDLGELTEEDFEILNPHEVNIKEAIDKTPSLLNGFPSPTKYRNASITPTRDGSLAYIPPSMNCRFS